MRRIVRQRWIKTGIVILGFLVVFAITFTLNRQYIKSNTDLVPVVVAAQKIGAFMPVKKGTAVLTKRPRSVVPAQAVADPDLLWSGKQYYASELGFGEGDIIRMDRLTEENVAGPGSLSTLSEQNRLLVAVNTNLVKSCANLVGPGVLVDAVVFIRSDLPSLPGRVISPAENPGLAGLLVIDKKNAESAFPAEKGREAVPAVITLAVDRSQVELVKSIVEYNEKGSIYLLPVGFKGDVYLKSLAR
ncbi:MAG: hypothetical protein QHH10_14255 [Peptococcaceae bacterium]|nr:hypothetical protein [Peptococcaceae bacterium]MDH7526456.1 hypothetical protein [Peptococcaceae bacterium]